MLLDLDCVVGSGLLLDLGCCWIWIEVVADLNCCCCISIVVFVRSALLSDLYCCRICIVVRSVLLSDLRRCQTWNVVRSGL